MSVPKNILHERVLFGAHGAGGDAHVIIDEGQTHVYLGMGGHPSAGVSVCLTATLDVFEVEALIVLLQRAIDVAKQQQAPACEVQP